MGQTKGKSEKAPKDKMIKGAPKNKKGKETGVAIRENATVKTPEKQGANSNLPASVEAMIMTAIERGTPVETMERILAMAEKVKANQAKEAFNMAMSAFQGECPTIDKKKDGSKTKSGQVAYKYAPLEDIDEQTKELRNKHGFSHSIKTDLYRDDFGNIKTVKATCVVRHIMGHSEETSMEVPLGTKTGVMSDSQQVAAASTFAKRYAFCNAFGIMTGDEDNDGQNIGSQGSQGKAEAGEQKKSDVARALEIIKNSTDSMGLISAKDKISKSENYTEEQKEIIIRAIDNKLKQFEVRDPNNPEIHDNASQEGQEMIQEEMVPVEAEVIG